MNNIELFKKLIVDNKLTLHDVVVYSPGGANHAITDIIRTESYLIVYSHTKGNHWNIRGNHYKTWHDINTGKYISEGYHKEKELSKDRLLMKDYKEIMKILKQQTPVENE